MVVMDEILKPDYIFRWMENPPAENIIPDFNNDPEMANYIERGYNATDWPLHDEVDTIFKNVSDWLRYIDYYLTSVNGVVLENLEKSTYSKEINGLEIRFPFASDKKTFNINGPYDEIVLKKENTTWGEEANKVVTVSTSGTFRIINSSVNSWSVLGVDTNGIMADNLASLSENLSVFFYILHTIVDGVEYTSVGGDIDFTGSNIISTFKALHSVDDEDVYIRRIGATATYNNGVEVVCRPVWQKGDMFYVKGTNSVELVEYQASPDDYFEHATSKDFQLTDDYGMAPDFMDSYGVNLTVQYLFNNVPGTETIFYQNANIKLASLFGSEIIKEESFKQSIISNGITITFPKYSQNAISSTSSIRLYNEATASAGNIRRLDLELPYWIDKRNE